MQTIDITPTPEGMAHSIELFEEQIAKSEHLIKVAEEWLELLDIERRVYVVPSEFPIFEAALEALQERERRRIEDMREVLTWPRGSAPLRPRPTSPPSWPRSRTAATLRDRAPVAAFVSMDDLERLEQLTLPARPRGALALVGAWRDVEEQDLDTLIADIYAQRAWDTGRAVSL